MKRRHFIQSAVSGVLLLGSGALSLQCAASKKGHGGKYGYQSKRNIPVIQDVDIVVVGGSSVAVAAAVAASRQGNKVFLVASEPYLGIDICGCYQRWGDYEKASRTELGNKLFGNGFLLPLDIKKILDNELIDNHVGFLYSSFVTDVISDENNIVSGVIIGNRSGSQAIKAKVVIDATLQATVARLSGAAFTAFPGGRQDFRYVVIGNTTSNNHANVTGVQSHAPVNFNNRSFPVREYSFWSDMKDDSWQSVCEAEQLIRGIAWDSDQIETSDFLFSIPQNHIVGKSSSEGQDIDPSLIDLMVFQPLRKEHLFVLSGYADVDRRTAAGLLQSGVMIEVAERIALQASILAGQISSDRTCLVKGRTVDADTEKGDVCELLNGLRLPDNLGSVIADATTLPVLGRYDVVVVGGGTAGAPAALGACRNGARTLVLEYLHALGGLGTMGKIEHYFDGYREGFTKKVDDEIRKLGGDSPRQRGKDSQWVTDWKEEFYRREIRGADGDIWFGVIGIGAYVDRGTVKGVVVATPDGKGVVLAHTVVDSTGSADIAIAAGAGYEYTDGLSVAVQGAGLPSEKLDDICNNTDWTFIDDTDMLDVWRTFVVAKDIYSDHYDVGKLLQTRERRRIIGDFTISALDIYNSRTYEDTFSVHSSTFDSHGFTEDPFFSLKPPAKQGIEVLAYVPFRALLPKGLDGIAVTGLGASASRDAMPVIRMQACLQNQGYSMGWAAANSAREQVMIRDVSFKKLQQELVEIGNLPEHVLSDTGNYPPSDEKVSESVKTVVEELNGLERLLWVPDRSIPLMKEAFFDSPDEKNKQVFALILGMLGEPTGWSVLKQKLDAYSDWDEGWKYRGMGQFGRSLSFLDSLVIALGKCKKEECIPSFVRMAEKLSPESEFSHFRAIAIAAENNPSPEIAHALYALLRMPGVTGHAMTNIQSVRKLTPTNGPAVHQTHFGENSTRNKSLRELVLGKALYKIGDINGLGKEIMKQYSHDLRGHYARHANGVLSINKH